MFFPSLNHHILLQYAAQSAHQQARQPTDDQQSRVAGGLGVGEMVGRRFFRQIPKISEVRTPAQIPLLIVVAAPALAEDAT